MVGARKGYECPAPLKLILIAPIDPIFGWCCSLKLLNCPVKLLNQSMVKKCECGAVQPKLLSQNLFCLVHHQVISDTKLELDNHLVILAHRRSWRCALRTRATSREPLPETCVLANHIARKMRHPGHQETTTPRHHYTHPVFKGLDRRLKMPIVVFAYLVKYVSKYVKYEVWRKSVEGFLKKLQKGQTSSEV